MRLSNAMIALFGALLPMVIAETNLDEPFTSSFAKLSHAPCVTLFNRNGRTGCGTEDRNVQVGELRYFDGSLPNTNKPFVSVLEEWDLTSDNLDTILAARGKLLQGILVLNSTLVESADQQTVSHSPDGQTPRGYGTPEAQLTYGNNQFPWNAKGEGLFEKDMYGVPMAYVTESDVAAYLRKEAQSDKADDAIVAEFNYYMGPDGANSSECLGWKDAATGEWSPKCLPLGGSSIWAVAGSPLQASSSNNNQNRDLASSSKRPVIIVGAGIDSTSMFHDITPGANSAASHILTLLMAAKLIGSNMNDATLDGLTRKIVFGFFQGDTYGFVGSRSFLRDVAYPGFQCYSSPVPTVTRLGDKSPYTCLHPLRHDLAFANIGQIAGMIAVDQVGIATADGYMYVHADNNDYFGAFMGNVMKYSATSTISVSYSSANSNNNNNGYPFPPSPLTSLLALSGGAVGGAILSGYDYAFPNKVPYHSHKDSASVFSIDLDLIASAATIVARSAVAAAYDDGSYDYETASAYAKNIIPELSSSDSSLVELADCLLYNGNCDLIQKYSSMEMANERSRTGLNLGSGSPLGVPPSYYVSVYNAYYGQPFVQVGDKIFGAYDGDGYGKKSTDAVGAMPTQLESTIHGLLDDFLGRGTKNSNGNFVSCKKYADCAGVYYCSSVGEYPTCTGGGECVCTRAHYHVAFDEAIVAAKNKPTGYFNASRNDAGVSPMYTEPYWSNSVGVRIYRDTGHLPGFLTLAAGFGVAFISWFSASVLRIGLKKQKLY